MKHLVVDRCPYVAPGNGFVRVHGNTDTRSSFPVGTWIRWHCNVGYGISGSKRAVAQCWSGGHWSAPVPSCLSNSCLFLISIAFLKF